MNHNFAGTKFHWPKHSSVHLLLKNWASTCTSYRNQQKIIHQAYSPEVTIRAFLFSHAFFFLAYPNQICLVLCSLNKRNEAWNQFTNSNQTTNKSWLNVISEYVSIPEVCGSYQAWTWCVFCIESSQSPHLLHSPPLHQSSAPDMRHEPTCTSNVMIRPHSQPVSHKNKSQSKQISHA